jgi:ferredoxin
MEYDPHVCRQRVIVQVSLLYPHSYRHIIRFDTVLEPSKSIKENKKSFYEDTHYQATLSCGQVVPDGGLCVQCGICSYNCPIGIDVDMHVWKKKSIQDSHCLTRGECVTHCPRGVLRFGRTNLFMENQE